MAGSNAAGYALIVVGIAIALIVAGVGSGAFGQLGGIGGNGGGGNHQQKIQVCDVTGSISGNVVDYNLDHYISDEQIRLSNIAGSCHEKGILDIFGLYSAIPDGVNPAALIGKGFVTVTVYVKDGNGETLVQKDIQIITETNQTSKAFTQSLLFKNMVKGQTYNVEAWDTWKDDGPRVQYTYTP
jgi:hypothetical protein